jgi:tripartite-type tricarboxylate transporter receptor subunit TctC
MMKRFFVISVLALLATAASLGALAQAPSTGSEPALSLPKGPAFPAKPVRIVVAFPAGGGVDIVARVLAPKLAESWGQQVIVDNRAGASGMIGTEFAARSAPDGYTLFMGTLGNLAVNQHLYPKMPVDPLREFAPVTKVVDVHFVMVAHPSLAARDVGELIALARSRPGQINYSSSGPGGAPHLAGELFKSMAKVNLVHVPYKGSGPSFQDLLGGQVSLTFDSLVQALPYIRSDKLKALAVLGSTRSPLLPEVPTVAESGLPGYELTNWFGLVAPAATPRDTLAKIHADVIRALQNPGVPEKFSAMGATVIGNTPEQFGASMRADSAKWGRLIKETGIRAE